MSGFFQDDGTGAWSMSRLVLFMVALALCLGLLLVILAVIAFGVMLIYSHPIAPVLTPLEKIGVAITVALVGVAGSYLVKMASCALARSKAPDSTEPKDPGGPA